MTPIKEVIKKRRERETEKRGRPVFIRALMSSRTAKRNNERTYVRRLTKIPGRRKEKKKEKKFMK